MMIKRLTIFLGFCLLAGLLCLTGCTFDAPKQEMPGTTETQTTVATLSKSELISSIIYSVIPESSSSDTTKLLNTLSVFDPEEAAVWKQILLYWDDANQPGFVSLPNISPDNLPQDDSLVIEVLGLGLLRDGSMREELIHRLETALACAEQYPNAYVLVTGGGTAAENPEATEADAMAAWLLEKGLSEDRLIIENRSKTTCENAVFSYNILHKSYPQIHSMVIVSSDYHISLGCMLFQAWFLLTSENVTPSISVIGNACCPSGAYTFTLTEQAYWLENLTTYRQ